MNKLLDVESLKIVAKEKRKSVTIVDNISFHVNEKETLGIVGESGCGKSMTAMALLRLLKKNQEISQGKILFKNKDLASMSYSDVRKICGKDIGVIFQEPMTALNPFYTVGRQLREPLIQHMKMSKKEANKRSVELLEEVGIKNPEEVITCYPHQISGGMKQRVMIAIAISCNPSLLIADEPTTALDVIIQVKILRLMKKLIREREMSLLLISHDFGVIAQMSDRVAVMYSGELVECASTDEIIESPKHPYTKALLGAAREISSDKERLTIVEGSVPRPGEFIKGCKFMNRCSMKTDICEGSRPGKEKITSTSWVRCFNLQDGGVLSE